MSFVTTATVVKKLSMATVGAMFIALGILNPGQAKAATIGSDSFGYKATDDIHFTFEDISTTGTSVLAGTDDTLSSANIGFDFHFYGINYNNVSFTANGLLTFAGTNVLFTNKNLTTTAPLGNHPSIAVLWDDWKFSSSGNSAVYYQTLGQTGNRRFITQWNAALGYPTSPSPVTFQSVLFEGSNDILLSYLDVDAGNNKSFGGNATVGIRDIDGQLNGRNLQWSFDSPVIKDSQSIRFSYYSPVIKDSQSSRVPEPASLVGLLALAACSTSSSLLKRQHQINT